MIAGQTQGREGLEVSKEAGGQGGEAVAGQIQVGQGTEVAEDFRGQGGEAIARQVESGQGIQTVEVPTLECADVPAGQEQFGDAAQMGRGDVPARGHPGCRHQGLAHHRRAAADAGLHLQGECEAGGPIHAVGGDPGVDRLRCHDCRRAGQCQRAGVQGQPGGQGGPQGVGRTATAAGGRRQDQGRHRGVGEIRLRRHGCDEPQRAEGGGVGHRHHDGAKAGDAPVAADGMADGGGVVREIVILPDADEDRLGAIPVCSGEAQHRGGDIAVVRGDGRRHHDIAGGGRVQPHGIPGRAALGHGEGVGRETHAGVGLGNGQDQSRVGELGGVWATPNDRVYDKLITRVHVGDRDAPRR